MVRSVVGKVMWVGRATVFLVGLAVILALLFGVATTALGANGDPWLLGRGNTATSITRLAGAVGVDGPMLRLINNNVGVNATALDLNVEPGKTPMTVNSDIRVDNLNADKLDGKTESDFQAANAPAAGDLTGNYPNPSLANGVVNSAKIQDGQVQNVDLGNNAVNSAKIADGAVNSAKIQDGQVQNADLGNGSVDSAKIANGSVTRADTSVFDTIDFYDPPSIPAGSCEFDTKNLNPFTQTQVGDVGYVYPLASVADGLMVQNGIRQSQSGVFQFKICNISNAAINDTQRVYGFRLVR